MTGTLIQKFTQKSEQSRAELQRRHQELDERAKKAAELQEQASNLQQGVDLAHDNLINATNQAQAFKLRLQDYSASCRKSGRGLVNVD
ncbi:MAG: hypothetical protein QOG67_2537 [Verrucomicrobiota bacterium]|jgi:uncharacterized coiled-coil DUF342 family protein